MRLVPLLLTSALIALPALAAAQTQTLDATRLTLYPGDGEGVPALVQQTRSFTLRAGLQTLDVDALAQRIETSALLLRFAADSGVQVGAIEIPPTGDGLQALLQRALGKPVQVLGAQDQILASGTLRGVEGERLLVQQADGTLRVVSGSVVLPAGSALPAAGAQARVQVEAARAGAYRARLIYPSGGLGWRADYTLTLPAEHTCRGTLAARATLVNHSGTDFSRAQVTLVAGQVRVPAGMPQPRMMAAVELQGTAVKLPAQSDLAGYRRYALAQPLNLPSGATVQVPLEPTATLDCTRTLLLGQVQAPGYTPAQPNFMPGPEQAELGAPRIEITLRAPYNLPAGSLRAYQADTAQALAYIGGDSLPDLRKGDTAHITLGNAYALRAERTRTAWQLAGKVLTEGLRVRFSNSGAHAETITYYVHPDRWRQWRLIASNHAPAQQDTDTLMWRIAVPAHGSATLDYTLRYNAATATGKVTP